MATVEVDTTAVNDVLAIISRVNNGLLMVSNQVTSPDLTEIVIVEQVVFG